MSKALGSGTFGKVYRRNGMAVKVFNDNKSFIQEYAMLSYLSMTSCQHLVSMKDVDFDKKEIFMDLYDMDLRTWIKNFSNPNMYRRVLSDILKGLIELHDRGLAHGDLKPHNILVNRENWKLVIGDCGFVTVAHLMRTSKTSPRYRDPEEIPDFNHDIYSFGMSIQHLLDRKLNYAEDGFYFQMYQRCIDPDRSKRPTARELFSELTNQNPPKVWNPSSLSSEKISTSKYRFFCEKIIDMQSSKKEKFKRGQKICIGLSMILRNQEYDHLELEKYLQCALILGFSLFGGKRIYLETVHKRKKYEYEEMYEIIKKLSDDKRFMSCIMSPKN